MVSCLGDRKGLNGHKPKKQVNSKKKKKQKQRNTNPNDCLSLRLANLNNYWKRILYRIRWQCFCGVAVDYVTNIETYPTLCLFFSLGGIGQGGVASCQDMRYRSQIFVPKPFVTLKCLLQVHHQCMHLTVLSSWLP